MAKKPYRKIFQNISDYAAGRTPEMNDDLRASGAETPDGETAAASEADASSSPSARERELEDRVAALNEKHIRLLAEYDNYRKRTAREMEMVIDVASERLVREFLPILDNLDRATEHRTDKTTFEDYVKGIALIEEQLRKVLARTGLQKMDVVGEVFDPAVHDAILQVESPDKEPGIIVGEAEKGYLLNSKVIRHPKVIISK